ncbi:MAG: protoheme IX farnesyltransferase [Anaerolineaceae bacterium]|nr:protoheme IX farnesyltransferase [Anaerolineaceae bacterium]
MESAIHAPQLSISATLKTYLELAKLRIVLLLLFTTITTMVIAANGAPAAGILIPTMIGGAMAAAGSSAINQYLDRDMDAKMARTSRRPIPSGRIKPVNALIFGLALVAWSVLIMGIWVNWLAAGLALFGGLYYVILYTLILKRNTVVNILIGGGAGAVPVLVGWAAVRGALSFESLILFAIVFYWTPPHSWALALLVNKDYAAANVPMMPVARGEEVTRRQILFYSVQLFLISLLPGIFGALGWFYSIAAALLGIGLIRQSVLLIQRGDGPQARRTYKYSTMYLAMLFLAMMIDKLI